MDIRIIEKPDWITWDDIKRCLVESHSVNLAKGINMVHYQWSADSIREFIGEDGVFLVALDGDKLVGTAAVAVKYGKAWYAKGKYAYMCFASVLPEYSGQGLFRALDARREAIASEKGLTTLLFDTHVDNKRRTKSGLKNGYRPVLFFRAKSKDHYNVIMAKWLGEPPYSKLYCWIRFNQTKAKTLLRYHLTKENKRVIVIGQGFTGRLSIVRSVAAYGCRSTLIVLCFGKNGGKTLIKDNSADVYSRYVDDVYYCHRDDEAGLMRILLEKCAVDGQKTVIFPDNDFSASVVDKHLDELEPFFHCPHIAHTKGEVTRWMNKIEQKRAAEAVGLNVVKASVVDVVNHGYEIPADVTYPCFAKPVVSIRGGKYAIRKCDNEGQLKSHLDKVSSGKDASLLLEEFKSIEREYALLGFSDGENVIIPGILEVTDLGHGSHFGVAVKGKIQPLSGFEDIVTKFKDLVRRIGFVGVFDIDFFESDGKLYFGELNLRFGGSGYAYTKAGVNLPVMAVKYFLGEDLKGLDTEVRQSLTYFNERMAIDDWYFNYISKREYLDMKRSSDISFVDDPDDPGPRRAYQRMFFRLKIKRLLKRWIRVK